MDKKTIILAALMGYVLGGNAQANRQKTGRPKAAGQVSGVVTDAATRQPLEGVQVVSGPFEAITDAEGRYHVGTPTLQGEIKLSRGGYAERTVALRGDTVKDVAIYAEAFRPVMSADAFTVAATENTLDEVLATRAGGSIRAIGRGALAAVGSNLFIRGYNSLNAGTQPLLVVDGTIWDEQAQAADIFAGYYQNPLADIDVNDIEDVQVLKDATSVYGAKGGNGVICITTKRSHSSVTRINADLSYGFNFRPKAYDMMDASDYRTYLSEVMKGSPAASAYTTKFAGFLGTTESAADYKAYHNNTDWYDEVYRTGNTQHYGISVDGSDDIARYAVSLGYTKNAATVKSVDFSRLNARINADITLLRTLNVGARLFYTYTARNLQDDGVNAYTSPAFIAAVKSPFLVPYSYTDDGTQLTNTLNDVDEMGVSNPTALIQNAKHTNTHYRFGISLAPQWRIGQGLSLEGRFSYSLVSTKNHYFSPILGVASQIVDGNSWQNTVKDYTYTQNNLYGDVCLDYRKQWGRSVLGAALSYRIMRSAFNSSYADGHNTGNEKVTNLNNSLAQRTLGGINTDWGSMALTAKAEYVYDGRYSVWAALAEEASSRFGQQAAGGLRMLGGTWAAFPSVGVAWMLGKEAFMRHMPVIGKTRVYAGYGLSGNDNFDGMNRYSYLRGTDYLATSTGLVIGGLANNKLRWETVRKLNAGIQLSLLDDRISIGFDYFHHATDHLLTYKKAAIETGVDYYLCNGGKMENRGVEATVEARPVALRNFSWMTSMGMSHYKNEITQLPDGDYTTEVLGGEVLTAKGNPAALFYGYKTQGIFRTTEEAGAANLKIQNQDASYSTFAAGDVHFVDTDGNGIINEADKQVIGDPNPDATGTFFNRFTYRRLSLEILCTYSLGNDVYNYQRQQLEAMGNFYNQTNAVRNRWKNEGQQTDIPRAVYGDPMGNSRFSDRWIEDGSFFKVKNVKLSYSFPVDNPYIHGLTVWAAAGNLLTVTKYLGIDPELSMNAGVLYQGVDNGLLANGRSLYMGVKINL